MLINDLKLFMMINTHHSVSAASRSMFLAQSTVSRRLATLENELKIKLFIRGKGHDTVTLTPAGSRFLSLAEQILLLTEDAENLHEQEAVRHLSLAIPDSIGSYILKNFFSRLLQQNPNWNMQILVYDSSQIYEMVVNRSIDIGLTNGIAPYPELNSQLVFQEDFVVLRRGYTQKTANTLLHPSELDSRHEVFQIFSDEYHHWHNFWWKPTQAKVRVNLAQFTINFLQSPDDWAILPESVARALLPSDGYISRFIAEKPPQRRCFLVTHKKLLPDKSLLLAKFYHQLQDYVQSYFYLGL